MAKKILKIGVILAVGMAGGILAGRFRPYLENPSGPVYITETKEIYIEENTALTESFSKVQDSIVGTRAVSKKGAVIEGSGLAITSDGLIITLNELIPYNWEFSFFINGEKPSYQVLKRDVDLNLALVKLEADNLPTLGFKGVERLEKGERVFLAGALFENGALSKTVNEGIIKHFNSNYIYTTIYGGNNLKGSFLFNISGEVLGVSLIGKNGEVYAIPSDVIRNFTGF